VGGKGTDGHTKLLIVFARTFFLSNTEPIGNEALLSEEFFPHPKFGTLSRVSMQLNGVSRA
jgi:hypothetical protein